MATNIVTTNYFRQAASTSGVNLSANSFKVALMNRYVQSASTATLKQITNWSQVSANEVSAANYSALPLTAATISATNADVIMWDGTDLTWNSLTLSAYGCSIYRSVDGLVVGFIEFTSPAVPINGSITIQWNTAGIMNIY